MAAVQWFHESGQIRPTPRGMAATAWPPRPGSPQAPTERFGSGTKRGRWSGSIRRTCSRRPPRTFPSPASTSATCAPGPDGNVWVTDFGGQIGRVPPAGVPTPFDVPASSAWDIVTGPDGNLWYTAPDGAPLAGRITTAGVATEFPLTPVGDPHGITVGPDGALWIALAVGNSIGRITTGGQFSEIKGLTAAARPEYIAAGPDNTLWFTEQDGNRIGRVTGIEQPQQPQPQPQPQPTPTDTTRPDVTGFRVTRTVFRLGGLGTVIRWAQSEEARVSDSVRASRRRALAECAARDALPVDGRVAPAPVQGSLRPEAPAAAGPLPDDAHRQGRCGQRFGAGPGPVQAPAPPLDLRNGLLGRSSRVGSGRGRRGIRRSRAGSGARSRAWAGRFVVHSRSLPGQGIGMTQVSTAPGPRPQGGSSK